MRHERAEGEEAIDSRTPESRERLPRVVGVLALAVGLLMGPSRLVLGVHWPTDLLGGWLLGGAVVCAAAAVVLARAQRVS